MKKSIRFQSFHIWMLICAGLILIIPAAQTWATPTRGVVVTVNEVAITQNDLEIERGRILAETRLHGSSVRSNLIAALNREIVENLIDRELLYQRAREKNLKIHNHWVEKSLKELKQKLGSAENYRSYLRTSKLNESGLKERLRKGLVVQRLLRRYVVRQIRVSEAEMRTFFRKHPGFFILPERVRVRHILITDQGDLRGKPRRQALLRIQDLLNKLQDGTNFAVLALEHSDGPSKVHGGDLGYLERGQMITAFAKAAFALMPGEVSDIVETHLGYHLIQMVDRLPASRKAYRQVREKINRTLRRNKEKKAVDAYLAELREKADIRHYVVRQQ